MYSQPGLLVTITCMGQVSFTTDQGVSFTDVTNGLAYAGGDVSQVTFFDGNIYASSGANIVQISDYKSKSPKENNVYKLKTFHEEIHKMISTDVGLFATSTLKGVLHSGNGTSWQTFNNGLKNGTDIQTLAYKNGTLIGAYNGIHQAYIKNGSIAQNKWVDVTNNFKSLTNETISRIIVDSDQLVVAVTKSGIYFAFMNDYVWDQMGKGLNTGLFVDALFVNKKNFLIGSGNNGIYNGTFQ